MYYLTVYRPAPILSENVFLAERFALKICFFSSGHLEIRLLLRGSLATITEVHTVTHTPLFMDGQTVFDFGRGAKSDKLHFRRFKFKDTMHAKFNVEKINVT